MTGAHEIYSHLNHNHWDHFYQNRFATTISPWVFSYQALQPFMSPIESSPLAMKHLKEFESGVPEIEFTVTLKYTSIH